MYKKIAILAFAVCVICIWSYVSPKTTIYRYAKTLPLLEWTNFEQLGSDDFTCTGLTYDGKYFWIADYGAKSLSKTIKTQPRLVQTDLNTIISEIRLKKLDGENVQGLAWAGDGFWIAVSDKAIKIDKEGNEIASFPCEGINGIAVSDDGTLWVLLTKKWILHLDTEGNVLGRIRFNYEDQDHIFYYNGLLYTTVGADYQGDNNYMIVVSPEKRKVTNIYRTQYSNSVEGLCIKEDKLYIANDGAYHHDKKGKSYITKYDLPS